MKTHLTLFIILLSVSPLLAQNPFRGTGQPITQTYSMTDFSRIALYDLDGTVEIEVGKPYSIETRINDMYASLLSVEKSDDQLNISFTYSKETNKYIEDTKIYVKITCPRLEELYHQGNGALAVRDLSEDAISITHLGNGPVQLAGSVDQLTLITNGNGGVLGGNLITKKANVRALGNGSVEIQATNELQAYIGGNGNVIQKGNGKISPQSKTVGNGRILQ